MRPAARVQAAIEILADVLGADRPAATALADWGRTHRFAGSGDRAVIGNLVYDTLRRKASAAQLMGEDTPRALALGTLRLAWGHSVDAIAGLAAGSQHGPPALSDREQSALARLDGGVGADWVRGDFPAWLGPSLARGFGAGVVAQAQALARRAPLDVRVNTLKTTRDAVLQALAPHGAQPAPLSPVGVRMAAPQVTGRTPNVEVAPEHGQGWYEVQDAGSQVAALLAGARHVKMGPAQQIADICAGAGGKSLAMAAVMAGSGTVHAYDADRRRLRPIHARIVRSGAANIQVIEPGATKPLAALAGRMDIVLVDAPCSGSGVWRRNPEAKWRLTPEHLAHCRRQQRSVLAMGAPLVRPGGRLVYLTCSVLPEENGDQVAAFLSQHPDFFAVPMAAVWAKTIGGTMPVSAAGGGTETRATGGAGLQLTPHTHATDGFFIAVLKRRGAV